MARKVMSLETLIGVLPELQKNYNGGFSYHDRNGKFHKSKFKFDIGKNCIKYTMTEPGLVVDIEIKSLNKTKDMSVVVTRPNYDLSTSISFKLKSKNDDNIYNIGSKLRRLFNNNIDLNTSVYIDQMTNELRNIIIDHRKH